MVGYLALRCLSWLVPLVPSTLGYRTARLLADVGFVLARGVRRCVLSNIEMVLGPDANPRELRRAARGVFRTGALNYFDLFRIPRLDLRRLEALIKVQGWEHVDEALRQGKGVVVVAPHLGNLDAVANLAVARGVQCTIPTQRLRSARMLDLVTRTRASQGIQIVPLAGRSALRELYRALGANGIVAIIGDRDLQGSGTPVAFFGRSASIPTGAVALALRTGAPLLAARSLRRDGGSFDVWISPPLAIPRKGGKDDVRLGTAMLAAMLEKFIREAPEQWIVFERFWSERHHADDLGIARLPRNQAAAG